MRKIRFGYQDSSHGQKLLTYHGPLLKVDVGYDRLWNKNSQAPPTGLERDLVALVDTGARHSHIDAALAAKLNLPVYDKEVLLTCNGEALADVCAAHVYIPSLQFTQAGGFAVAQLIESFKCQVILGRSFLSYVKLEYDGTTGDLSLEFPEPKEHQLGR